MKSKGASLSALGPAVVRAIESSGPKEDRLFEDNVSISLLPPFWRVTTKFMCLSGIRNVMLGMRERMHPGIVGNIICRTRYIDDALSHAIREGFEQVVILGAGFDSRAYRIQGIEQLSVFEVDLPIPQDQKKNGLERLFGPLPSHVTFVPIDFNQQVLVEVMLPAGFHTNARTVIIWEGVTQYITAEAVDATLQFVSHNTASGSKIVFTYINQGIIDGSTRSELDQKVVSAAKRIGMPWIFGINPAELEQYLSVRGLKLIEDVGDVEYQVRYLNPIGRQLKVFEGERVALAQTL